MSGTILCGIPGAKSGGFSAFVMGSKFSMELCLSASCTELFNDAWSLCFEPLPPPLRPDFVLSFIFPGADISTWLGMSLNGWIVRHESSASSVRLSPLWSCRLQREREREEKKGKREDEERSGKEEPEREGEKGMIQKMYICQCQV